VAVAHFCLLLAMGSALVPPEMHAVDDEEWGVLLQRVVAALSADESHTSATLTTGAPG
jgi:hypothetical protein